MSWSPPARQAAALTEIERARRDLVGRISEAEWQEQVVQLAHALGWSHLHVRRSIGKGRRWVTSTNVEGWPDLFLWHPRRRFAAIELKVPPNEATPEQEAVLAQLAAAGARTIVAYPNDLETVRALLAGDMGGNR